MTGPGMTLAKPPNDEKFCHKNATIFPQSMKGFCTHPAPQSHHWQKDTPIETLAKPLAGT
jgi:hypothetical protein